MRAQMPSAGRDASFNFLLEQVREPDVSTALDRELRALISGAFNQPRDAFFKERRYAQEMPQQRYMLRSTGGQLVAHLAVHEKVLGVGGSEVPVGGMAEVCVHESARGRGCVRYLLDQAHGQLSLRGREFGFLFGDSRIYASSGYRPVSASIRHFDPASQRFEDAPNPFALVKPLGDRPWPEGAVDLRGPLF
jgi:predicted N-acetyltransferase YhbS